MEKDLRKTFALNLGDYMRMRGKTQTDLQVYMKCSSSTVSDWCNGNKFPRPDKMQRISEFLGVLMSDLTADRSQRQAIPQGFEPMPRMVSVPLIGSIACGEPITAEQMYDGYKAMPEHVKADFALRCKGDSMVGARIMDGDIVYIRSQPDVSDGEIAAVLVGDEATLKRVYHISGSWLQLRPENPSYHPMDFKDESLNEVRILGKAVAFCSAVR